MSVSSASLPGPPDLEQCAREPIHVPGAVQPFGFLLALRTPDLTVLQASENIGAVGFSLDEVLGEPLSALLDDDAVDAIRSLEQAEALERTTSLGREVGLRGRPTRYEAFVHRSGSRLVVEFEPAESASRPSFRASSSAVQTGIDALAEASGEAELCARAAAEVRRITGFDRVMVYRFDEDWHGEVVAEDKAEDAASYFGLHFPATDIPAQARRLYTASRIRLIADVDYAPAVLRPVLDPETNAPLDLSQSILRSVSPVHLEYLRNMKVRASMSVSIMQEGRLWGLVACHHRAPLRVPASVRTTCAVLSQVLALRLAREADQFGRERRAHVKAAQAALLEQMVRSESFVEGLTAHETNLCDLVRAGGAAVLSEDRCILLGETPGEEEVRALAAWLHASREEDVYATHRLGRVFPAAKAYADVASGLMAVSLSRLQKYYVLWFRPEVPQTVYWAGNPDKAVEVSPGAEPRLHPRKSFAKWKDVLRGHSLRWTAVEVEAARELRRAITDVVLVRAEELSRLNASLRERNRELQEFAYVASHDLQEPLRKIQTFGDLIRSEHADGLPEEVDFFLSRIRSAAERMSRLISDLLDFSRVLTHAAPFEPVALQRVVDDVQGDLELLVDEMGAEVVVGELPVVEADPRQMRRLFSGLLHNALTFRRDDEPPRVEVHACRPADAPGTWEITVEDNGIGFEEKYVDRIFTPFQQLHGRDAYDGTGMGLAVCKRIVARHGGSITARSRPGEGSTFLIRLPEEPPPGEGSP